MDRHLLGSAGLIRQVLASMDAARRLEKGLPRRVDGFSAAAILDVKHAAGHDRKSPGTRMRMPTKHFARVNGKQPHGHGSGTAHQL